MSAGAADDTRPVTAARVVAALSAQGYRVTEVAERVLAGTWEGNAFTIALVGDDADVLQVRGTWRHAVDADAGGLAQMLNDWNRDRIWPKVYSRTSDDGVRVVAETTFLLSEGASDAQLGEFLACGLGTGVQFFEAMSQTLGR